MPSFPGIPFPPRDRAGDSRRQAGLDTCEQCGGSGTEQVAHGSGEDYTTFSGDDNCPGCAGSGKARTMRDSD